MKIDEKVLLNGLKEGNKAIFDLVFTYYYSGLCAFVNRYVNNPEAAEDLVQDFFVRLWFNTNTLDINTSIKSYLFASVKNRALDYLKHAKVKSSYAGTFNAKTTFVQPEDTWEFCESELLDLIDKGLQQLPPRTREIFEMSRYKGISNDQIAETFGISKRTVEVQISTALKILRIELKDYLPLAALFLGGTGLIR
jgi:RNA polymerase sigma-70 factor, ECF subfamily